MSTHVEYSINTLALRDSNTKSLRVFVHIHFRLQPVRLFGSINTLNIYTTTVETIPSWVSFGTEDMNESRNSGLEEDPISGPSSTLGPAYNEYS